jgi:hypothetical protein
MSADDLNTPDALPGDPSSFVGPLHLQRYLMPTSDKIAEVIRSSVGHPVNLVSSLHCQCISTGVMRAINPAANPIDQRTAEARRKNIESSRARIDLRAEDREEDDRRRTCRFFSLRINDEEGIVHSFCRRCNRMVLVYDRALYWGIKRDKKAAPETFPYKCSCGSHTFEVAVGFNYPDEALDENDIDTITVAVRCATCMEIAIVFDDEAT